MSHILRHEKNMPVSTGNKNVMMLQFNSSLVWPHAVQCRWLEPVKMGHIFYDLEITRYPQSPKMGLTGRSYAKTFDFQLITSDL